MYESFSAEQRNATGMVADPVAAKAADYFAKASGYEPPKVVTFPLHGMCGAGVTSLTGNT
jgi:hypothetical protein